MYIQDLSLNNLQGLICHKTQSTFKISTFTKNAYDEVFVHNH